MIKELIRLRAILRREIAAAKRKAYKAERSSYVDEDSGSYDEMHRRYGEMRGLEFAHGHVVETIERMKQRGSGKKRRKNNR